MSLLTLARDAARGLPHYLDQPDESELKDAVLLELGALTACQQGNGLAGVV